MRRIVLYALGLSATGALAAGWTLTAPRPMSEAEVAGLTGNPSQGEAVFWAAGCASCHMAPDAKADAAPVLAGGMRFASDFGTFIAPNISPSEQGLGGWSLRDFASAVMRGVSPQGTHYFPAFPYNAYNKMRLQEVADLKAFLETLPPDATPSRPHEVGFPFNIRRSLGGWKWMFERDAWVVTGDLTAPETRGRYIVEALAHCGECHTPRNALGGLIRDRWLAGAPNPDGKGRTPNITPAKLTWSEADIKAYLTTGFTPDYDSVGGHMAAVVSNMAKLPEADRAAVAAYLKIVPARD